jgi:hypothetical protein
MPHKSEQGNGHWILSTDGSKPIQITQTPDEVESYPQWSPDGKMIAFYRCGSDREMLQVIPAAGGTARTILTTPKEQFGPFGWSPDGKEVVVAGDETITSLPISGGTARVIVRLQDAGYESASWLGWSPDGQRLAFYGGKRGEASRLCLFSPSTGKIATLENSPEGAYDFIWSPDSTEAIPTPGHAVENGELMLANASARLDVMDWTDYVVTVRVCMKESVASGEGVLGINARTTPSNFGIKNRDRYQLVIVCNNNAPQSLYLGITYRDASNTPHNGNLGGSPCSLVRDKWYTLEFEVRGQHLRGYLDGKLMVEATDARLSKGGIWLNTWRARALFDDFSVRQLP